LLAPELTPGKVDELFTPGNVPDPSGVPFRLVPTDGWSGWRGVPDAGATPPGTSATPDMRAVVLAAVAELLFGDPVGTSVLMVGLGVAALLGAGVVPGVAEVPPPVGGGGPASERAGAGGTFVLDGSAGGAAVPAGLRGGAISGVPSLALGAFVPNGLR